MNDVNLILRLNNYGYTPEVVNEVLEFKRSGAIPEHIIKPARYKEK